MACLEHGGVGLLHGGPHHCNRLVHQRVQCRHQAPNRCCTSLQADLIRALVQDMLSHDLALTEQGLGCVVQALTHEGRVWKALQLLKLQSKVSGLLCQVKIGEMNCLVPRRKGFHFCQASKLATSAPQCNA